MFTHGDGCPVTLLSNNLKLGLETNMLFINFNITINRAYFIVPTSDEFNDLKNQSSHTIRPFHKKNYVELSAYVKTSLV